MRNSKVLSMDLAGAITPERLEAFDDEATAVLARRLEDDDYPTPFAGLSLIHI